MHCTNREAFVCNCINYVFHKDIKKLESEEVECKSLWWGHHYITVFDYFCFLFLIRQNSGWGSAIPGLEYPSYNYHLTLGKSMLFMISGPKSYLLSE